MVISFMGGTKSVANLRQWYTITNEQAADPNLMNSTSNAQILVVSSFLKYRFGFFMSILPLWNM
ncbi:hypothetical protein Scep_017555 [Stephania cephalantha]|uniref:Uncharacterized protein n=1 Tax=Stephania cephalantha TaxID=152367 RepID=A0AAP0IRL5_9MAGN